MGNEESYMNKTDLLSIKKFSEFTGIKQSVLRYYDEIGLFRPIFRGNNNYRYYSCQQITTVNLINVLTGLDIPRKKIIQLERNRNPQNIIELFSHQEAALNEQLRQISESYSIIRTFRELIEQGISADETVIQECTAKRLPLYLGPKNQFSKNTQFYNAFIECCSKMKRHGIHMSYPIGGYYQDLDSFIHSPSEPENFFSLIPTGTDAKVAGRYLVGYTRGYYGEMGDLPQRLQSYAEKNNLVLEGPVYAIYLHDEISVSDTEQYLVQVSVSIKKDAKS